MDSALDALSGMSALDKMLARAGKKRDDVHPLSNTGKLFRKRGLPKTAEFMRVATLPRRDWQKDQNVVELAKLLTTEYRRDGGAQELRPVQAAALAEIHDYRGLFAPMRVSSGKTLVSFLAPAVLGAERPLLLVPAKLRTKTEHEWWAYSKHWKLPRVRVESYELLGRAGRVDYLNNYRPDLIFADEGHKLKNTRAAVTRRVSRYLRANGATVIVASGTLTKRSVRDYWHFLKWTLGDDNMPLPNDWAEMMEWAAALDVLGENTQRMAPGALYELCTEDEQKAVSRGGDASLEAARQAYQRRLVETPGVISTTDKHVGCSLLVSRVDLDLSKIGEHFRKLRAEWETPDGWPFSEATDLWRHARELVCGFYYVWDPRPPPAWLDARRNWCRFVRQTLKHSHRWDTELQVAREVASDRLSARVEIIRQTSRGPRNDVVDVYAEWQAVKNTFKPNTVARWVSGVALEHAAKWLRANEGVVWVEHTAFGEKLSEISGFPYHGRQGLDESGRTIESAVGSVIASVAANSEGRNLQKWSKSLVVSSPPNGQSWEQLLGRMHRDGQQADEVVFETVLACKEQLEGFFKACKDAAYIGTTTGQPQKLQYADLDVPTADEVATFRGAQWM